MQNMKKSYKMEFLLGLLSILLILLIFSPSQGRAESKPIDNLKTEVEISGNPIEENPTEESGLDKTVDIRVKIFWNDDGNLNASRPDKFLVKLLADGVETARSLELNEAEMWEGSFDGLSLGDGIKYSISIDELDGYKSRIYGEAEEGFEIVNNILSKEEVADSPEREEELIIPEEIIIEPKKALGIDSVEAKTNEEEAPSQVESQDQTKEETQTQEAKELEKEEIQSESKPDNQEEVKDQPEEKKEASPEREDQVEVLEEEEKNFTFPINGLILLGLPLLIIVFIKRR